MFYKKDRSLTGFLAVALAVVTLDQASKLLVLSLFDLYETRPIIPGFFNLTYVTNTGAAFGLLAGNDAWRHLFFLAINIGALIGLASLYLVSAVASPWLFWGTSLVFGGALGNLTDRVRLGSVVDFLDFHVGPYHWPAFNVADSAICVGGALLAWHFLRPVPSRKKN